MILSAPANDFVENFLGSGAALKRLHLRRVRDVELSPWPTAIVSEDREKLRGELRERLAGDPDHSFLLMLDAKQRPVRWLSGRDLERSSGPVANVGLPVTAIVQPHATLHDALDEMITSNVGCAVVVNTDGAYQGVVDIDTVMTAINALRKETRARFAVGAWHGVADPREDGGPV